MKNKLKKIVPAAVAIALTTVVVFSDGISVIADELRQRQQGLNIQIQEVQVDIRAIEAQRTLEMVQIEQLEYEILQTENAINVISGQLYNTQNYLDQVSQDLEEAQMLREEQQDRLVSRARAMHMNGPITYLDAILSATSFSELLMRLEFIGRIIDHDNNLVNELRETEERIEQNYQTIYSETQRLMALELQYNTRLTEHDRSMQDRLALLDTLTAEQRAIQEQYLELERSMRQVQDEISRRDVQARATRAATTQQVAARYTGNGIAGWPVPSRLVISSPFGPRRSPISGRQEQHRGIDIPAPNGNNIVSSMDGVVIFVGWMNGYGNTIKVEHANGLVTLYAHNSANLVSVGESVKRGQVIGRIGSTGWSTGPHLHFEIIHNGVRVNPMSFLNE